MFWSVSANTLAGKLWQGNSAGVHPSWPLPVLCTDNVWLCHINKVIAQTNNMWFYLHFCLHQRGDFAHTDRVMLHVIGRFCSHQQGDFSHANRVFLLIVTRWFCSAQQSYFACTNRLTLLSSTGWFCLHGQGDFACTNWLLTLTEWFCLHCLHQQVNCQFCSAQRMYFTCTNRLILFTLTGWL